MMSVTAEAAPVKATQAVPDATADGGPGFRSTAPVRVLDTRSGLGAPAAPLGAGRSVDVQLTGMGGVPASGVAAVVFNLTAVAPTAGSFLSVYPTGHVRPTASTLNFATHQTIANEVIATVGTGGKVTIYNDTGSTHVLADVTGWFATGSYYTGLTPARVLDTRIGNGVPKAPVGPGQSIDVQITGRGGVPSTATAVAINLTGTQPSSGTFITAYPTGQPRPTSSNLNLVRGQTAAVLDVAKLGAGGRLTLYNDIGTVALIADVTGWFAATGQFTPINPVRIADTRTTAPLGPGQTGEFAINPPVVPEDAPAVVLSVTAVAPTALGFLTVFPAGTERPLTSTVNFTAGHNVPNLAVVGKAGAGVWVFNSSGSTHIVIDVIGWFAAPLALGPVTMPDAALPGSYSRTLSASGGSTPYTWTVASGTLPAGLALAPSGPSTATLAGTPTTAGTSTFTVQVTDAEGQFDQRTLSLTVQPFASGAVWAWGFGTNGELGNGVAQDSATPLRVSGLSSITAISAGDHAGYALREDGTVWAWGENGVGQLGDGTFVDHPTPVQVTGLTEISAIAAGDASGYALKADGTVWAWGNNDLGELGTGSPLDHPNAPEQVVGLTDVIAIAGGESTGYALRQDGTVWAWGDNHDRELGEDGLPNSRTPVQVLGLAGVTAIDAGADTGYALRQDGTVWAWGRDFEGQVGNGTNDPISAPVQASGLAGVIAISAGEWSGYALKADGTVWAWGSNTRGQLGNGTTVSSSVPGQVIGMTDVTAVVASSFTALVLRSDGAVWAWGSGASPELGTGGSVISPTPIRVNGMPPVTALAGGAFTAYALGAT